VLLDQLAGLLGVTVLVEIDHRDVRALLREEDGDGASDATVTLR
jgi:hypothetical protein